MSGKSSPLPIDELVARMKQKDFSLGWSAIAAYDLEKANRLLRQEYFERYGAGSPAPSVAGAFEDLDGDDKTWVGGVTFDAPQLSFDESSLDSSSATLSWQALDGPVLRLRSFAYSEHASAWQVVEVRNETSLNGSQLQRTVNLDVVDPQVDRSGEVYFDLGMPDAEGSARYTIAPGPAAQRSAGAVLVRWLAGQPPAVRRFILNKIGTQDEGLFIPIQMKVRVYPKSTEGSGRGAAVLLFMAADEGGAGSLPNPHTYEYPLAQHYSATLILSQACALRRFLEMVLVALTFSPFRFSPASGIPNDAYSVGGGLLTTPIFRPSDSSFSLRMASQLLPYAANASNPALNLSIKRNALSNALQVGLAWQGNKVLAFEASLPGGEWRTYHVRLEWHVTAAYILSVSDGHMEQSLDSGDYAVHAAPLDLPSLSKEEMRLITGVIEGSVELFDLIRFAVWSSVAISVGLDAINGLRLNHLLFNNADAVGAETVRMAHAPVIFGQVSPSRTRFSILPRLGQQHTDSLSAGQSLTLHLENTEASPTHVDWLIQPVFGAALGANLGQVHGQGAGYTYTAPPASALQGGYLVVRLVAQARFSGDNAVYTVRTLIKVYRNSVQVAPAVRLLAPNENLYLTANSLGEAPITGGVDSPPGPTNELLAEHKDPMDPVYNWRYRAPATTTEFDANQPSCPTKPMAVGYRALTFTQASGSGQGRCDVVVPYYGTTLSIEVVSVVPLLLRTLVTLRGHWKHDGSRVLPSEGVMWSLPLDGPGVTIEAQADGTALLALPHGPLRSFVAVEVRRFYTPDVRCALPTGIEAWRWSIDAPPPKERPDYVGVRLFPLPWLNVPEPS